MPVAQRQRGPTSSQWLSGLLAILALGQAARGLAAGPSEATKLDCGVNALFILLRLEGHSITLDRLDAALPPRRSDGYSMSELTSASQALGLGLEGVRFVKGDKALNRPAIAYFKDARGGHFAVLGPVGTTGTMVQVIDPPHPPWITDYDRLFGARTWTGRILVPRDPWLFRNAAPIATASAGLLLLGVSCRHRLRNAAARHPREHELKDSVAPPALP